MRRVPNWAPALFVVLLAFALRLHGLEHVRQNYDRAYPHGLGIAMREAIAGGRLDQVPTVSLVASINLPNPAGASAFYALLTAIEPSPYVATALNAMLGALVAAIAYSLARRLFGTWAGVAAGLLASASVWSAWVARGAWLQGSIEAMAALAAWLLINGIAHGRPRHLFAGLAWVALCMQTYLVAFGLLAQALAALMVGAVGVLRSAPALRRAALAGLALCALSALLYLGAVAASRAPLSGAIDNPNAANEQTAGGALNLDPVNHALRIASGRDFENTFVAPDSPGFALRDQASDLRATIIDGLLVIGIIMTAMVGAGVGAGLRPAPTTAAVARATAAAIVLAWFALPVAATFIIGNAVMREWKVHVFYLLLTSPMPYVLAGAPFGLLERAAGRLSRPGARALRGALAGLAALALAIAGWNADGDVAAAVRFPYTHDGLYSLPLKWQMALAREAAATCDALSNEEDAMWLTSLTGSARRVRANGFRASGSGTVWQVAPDLQQCVLSVAGGTVAAGTPVRRIEIPGQKSTDGTPVVAEVITSPPAAPSPSRAVADGRGMAINLGWTLLDLAAPSAARPGEAVTVTHVARVDQLPAEPYASWYFAPFVKLIGPDGQALAQVDDAPAIEGWAWRPGEVMITDVQLRLPVGLAPGEYSLEVSLFDPNQKKNAVYFDPVAPGSPVVTIRRTLSVTTE